MHLCKNANLIFLNSPKGLNESMDFSHSSPNFTSGGRSGCYRDSHGFWRWAFPHAPSAMMAMSAALCIQIGTNLANDYFDFKKGADTPDRKGPTRVTQAGLIKPQVVLIAAMVFFALAALSSIYLIHHAGTCILIVASHIYPFGNFLYGRPKTFRVFGTGGYICACFLRACCCRRDLFLPGVGN